MQLSPKYLYITHTILSMKVMEEALKNGFMKLTVISNLFYKIVSQRTK